MRQAWIATLLLACSQVDTVPAPAPKTPVSGPTNLLLISIDTLRADHVGAYGYLRPTTPNLDRLASQGVVFEAAWSQSPWTLPSHASLLTGLYTRGHGLRDDGHRLSRDVPVLFELLRDTGYRTGAIVNTVHLLGRTNLVRGVEHYEYQHSHGENGDRVLSLEAGVASAIDFLAADDPRPFFLLLHTYDVHSDYLPGEAQRELLVRPYDGPLDGDTATLRRIRRGLIQPGPADVRHLVDLYDAAIRQMDDRLGRLLRFLDDRGLSRSTLVVVTSDHGEEFYERGSVMHGRTVYEEMLRVPLIVRGPGVPERVRVAAPVALVDVAPTLLRSAGWPVAHELDGRDLAPLWEEPREPELAPVFAEVDARELARDPAANLTAVRHGNLKLIHDRDRNTSQLFHLSWDREERSDVGGGLPAARRQLEELARRHIERPGAAPLPGRLSAEDRALLEQLGYGE